MLKRSNRFSHNGTHSDEKTRMFPTGSRRLASIFRDGTDADVDPLLMIHACRYYFNQAQSGVGSLSQG